MIQFYPADGLARSQVNTIDLIWIGIETKIRAKQRKANIYKCSMDSARRRCEICL